MWCWTKRYLIKFITELFREFEGHGAIDGMKGDGELGGDLRWGGWSSWTLMGCWGWGGYWGLGGLVCGGWGER